MAEYIVGYIWIGLVAWAIVLTFRAKQLPRLKRMVILVALILSFAIAVLAYYEDYEDFLTPNPRGESDYV